MRAPLAALAVVVTLFTLASAPVAARAQDTSARAPDTLEGAMGLYASAAYDEALAMLERLPKHGLDATAQVSIDHYRMLCLLALGRTDEAEAVVAGLLDVHPTYRISAGEASPRVMKVFLDARRRALPAVARRRYEQARKLYADWDYAGAATEFGVVRVLVTDPDLPVADASLADLAQLAAGFEDLSREAVAAAERKAADAKAAAEAAEQAREAERIEAARRAAAPPPLPPSPPEPADGVYDMDDPGVIPPVALRQDLRRWSGPLPPPAAGTPLGLVQFVVNETGAVVDPAVISSVSGFYDAVLIESVKQWRYQPATKNGSAVKFRRVLTVVSR